MERDIENMGEEEIKARIETLKIWITAWLGAIFIPFFGVMTLLIQRQDILINTFGYVTLIVVVWFIIILRFAIFPTSEKIIELARELDRHKKKE